MRAILPGYPPRSACWSSGCSSGVSSSQYRMRRLASRRRAAGLRAVPAHPSDRAQLQRQRICGVTEYAQGSRSDRVTRANWRSDACRMAVPTSHIHGSLPTCSRIDASAGGSDAEFLRRYRVQVVSAKAVPRRHASRRTRRVASRSGIQETARPTASAWRRTLRVLGSSTRRADQRCAGGGARGVRPARAALHLRTLL